MDQSYYLINNQLKVQPLSSYLSRQGTWWAKGLVPDDLDRGEVVGKAAGRGIPVVPSGVLQAGVTYGSSTDPSVRFYLPEYRLNVDNGRYTSRLKWRDEHGDPNGPLAFLTLDVVGVVPPVPGGGVILQEMPHQAVARIAYQMPVQDGAGPPPGGPFAAFLGNWTNVDPNTRSMTRLEITPLTDQAVTFHGFGKCHPEDCDWELTQAHRVGDALVGTYDFGFKQTTITVRRQGDRLMAEEFNHYAPGDGRPDRTERDTLSLGGQPPGTAEGGRPVLWIEVGALNPVGNGVRRARLAITEKRDFDRLYQVMTDSEFNARLEIRCFATIGQRTWRQLVLSSIDPVTQATALRDKKVLYTNLVPEKVLATPVDVTAPGPNIHRVKLDEELTRTILSKEAVQLADTPLADLVREAVQLADTPLADLVREDRLAALPQHIARELRVNVDAAIRLNPNVLRIAPQPSMDVISASVLHEVVVQPFLRRAFTRPLPVTLANSDILTKVGTANLKAVPVKAVVDEDGPALIQVPVEVRQEISPFWFLVETNGYMFDIPGDMRPGTHHILIRLEVRDGGGQVIGVFYQDSAYVDQFYYQPQEFRLPRLDVPPYLPDLRIVFFELVAQDNGGNNEAILNYKVQLAYRVLPYINPLLLDLAQQQVPAVQAHFNALAPESSRLSLRVPEDESGGALADVPRPAADVRFDQGIVDQIELTRTEFERIFAFFQSPSGMGIDGAVEASLLGNVTASVPVRLSLKENTGTVFGHTYLGPIGGGVHRVRLVNRIESPVTITGLYRVTLGGNVFAFPQAAPGQVVQPGGQLDLDYRVDPPGTGVPDIGPALSVSIDADPRRLWPQLFINQGYMSETFPLHLSIEPDFFGVVPPAGSDRLSGVRVEFDDGTTATLTAALLHADVRLRIPLLPRLLQDPQAKQYHYRVTNLLGADAHEGEKSGFIAGTGEAPLTIIPVGA